MSIRESIQQFIVDELLFGDSQQLTSETHLLDAGVLDSLGILRMVEFLESQFKFKVNAQDINKKNFKSIDALVCFVEENEP